MFFSQTVVSLSQGTGADLQPDKNLEGLILVFPSPIQQSQPPEPVCPSADTGFFPGLPAIPDLHLRDNVVKWLQPGSFSGLGNLDHFHQNYDLSDLSLATQHLSSNPICQPMWNHPPHPPSCPPQLSPLSSSPCSPLPGPSIISSGQEHPPLPGQQPGQQNLPGGGLGSAEEPWRGRGVIPGTECHIWPFPSLTPGFYFVHLPSNDLTSFSFYRGCREAAGLCSP